MKCPKCGRELRRSPSEPNMGLCDNCMMKFDWVEPKKKKCGCLKFIVIFFAIIGILFTAILLMPTDSDEDSDTKEEKTPVELQDNEEDSDNIIDVDINDLHVKYIKHEIVKNSSDDKCIAIYFEFTNNTDENKAFYTSIRDTAFQDGVELESSIFHVNEESRDSNVEIQPGKTITLCEAFVLRDDENDVELTVGEFWSDSDDSDDEMILKIK